MSLLRFSLLRFYLFHAIYLYDIFLHTDAPFGGPKTVLYFNPVVPKKRKFGAYF